VPRLGFCVIDDEHLIVVLYTVFTHGDVDDFSRGPPLKKAKDFANQWVCYDCDENA
jgi:hypothetical protein